MSVQVRLLGPVDVVVDGTVLPLPGLRRKAVLARLALRPGEAVSVDRLIDAVWDGRPPATAVNSLQSHVSYLRRLLGGPDTIRARAPGYVLTTPATDLHEAEELVEHGRGAADPAERLASLRRALDLWRGQPLADVSDLPWFAHEADRLERMRRAAEQAAIECRLALGQHAPLVPELAELAERHPFDEDLHGQLMVALYRSGRQADALAVFHGLRERLREELGIDPSGPLRGLESAILRQDPGLDPAPVAAVAAGPGRPAGGMPLIERAEETGLVDRSLDEAVSGGTGSVLIFEGPAGMGKTSLLDHARKRASALGFTVVSARGGDLETDYAWACARQLFHRYTEADDVTSPFPAAPDGEQAAGGEYRTITSLYWLTSDLAARDPLLIVLDDLHWADPPSAQFLAFLAARLDAMRAVLVVGLRPGHERVERFTAALGGLPHSTVRTLRPLTSEGCAALLSGVIAAPAAPELVDQCHALTRGNPFLLREIALRFAESGEDPREALLEGSSPSVNRFVDRQLRYLPPGSMDVAHVLAVLGDGAGGDRLARIARITPRQALDALAPLVSSQLVAHEGIPLRFSFAHPLIRASVYDAIPTDLRTELHLRAAHVAMDAHDPLKAAAHFLRVPPGLGDRDPVPVLSEAAELSLARGAVTGAVNFLRRILEEDLGERRTGTLARLGTAEALVDTRRAVETLSDALAREPDPETRARISYGLASTLWLASRPRDAARVCQASLERDRTMSPEARYLLQACMIMVSYGMRFGSGLVPLFEGYAGQELDSSVGGLALDASLALHDMYQNRRESAEQRALKALAGDRVLGHPMAEPLLTCAWYTLVACDSPALLPSVETALDHSRRTGSLRAQSPCLFFRAEGMYAGGYLAEALGDAQQAWELGQYITVGLGETFIANVLLQSLVACGEVEKAVEVLQQAKDRQAPGLTPTLYANGEITVLLALGRTRQAFEKVLATRDECRAMPILNPQPVDWRAPLVRCLALLGRDEEAREAADDLIAASAEWGTARAVGRALRYAASVQPEPRALEMLAESVHLLDGTQANLERARSLYAFGAALARSGRVEEARARLSTALELAAFCGARPLHDTVRTALRRAGGVSLPSASPVLTGLTPTEAKAAELSGAGLSEREIAEELHLTVGSVRQHLAAIARKRPGAAGPSPSR